MAKQEKQEELIGMYGHCCTKGGVAPPFLSLPSIGFKWIASALLYQLK
jgi:hypothetical protein